MKKQNFKNSIPETAGPIVEISVSSLKYDRENAKVYSKGNVQEYWIVDAENRNIEVYTVPETETIKVKSFTISRTISLHSKNSFL